MKIRRRVETKRSLVIDILAVLLVMALLLLAVHREASAQVSNISIGGAYNSSKRMGFSPGGSVNIDFDFNIAKGWTLSNRFVHSREAKFYVGDGSVTNDTVLLGKTFGPKTSNLRSIVFAGGKLSTYTNSQFGKQAFTPVMGTGVNYRDNLLVRGEWLTRSLGTDPVVSGLRLSAESFYSLPNRMWGFKTFASVGILRFNQNGPHTGVTASVGGGIYLNLSAINGQ